MNYLTTIIVLFCCLASGVVEAQDNKSAPAPENHVLDKANVFREQPAKLAEITSSLKRLQEKHGYDVYLAVYYNLLDSSVQERADRLYEEWLGEKKRGLIIVTQLDPAVDGRTVAISYYRTSGLEEGSEGSLIPDRNMQSLCSKAFSGTDENDAERIMSMIVGLESEIDAYYAVKPSRWSDAGNLKMMAVLIGAIIFILILGTILWKVFSKADVESNQKYYFPEVEVAKRLGAPYGGGWISQRSFAPSSAKK